MNYVTTEQNSLTSEHVTTVIKPVVGCLTNGPIAVDATGAPAQPLQLQQDAEGRWICRFNAGPGLYQVSVVVDAREYDWERTYVSLHKYNNKGQRTGPWDFELGTNRPLIPSYWVDLDGQRLGMWFFQRVTLDDIDHRRFRGHVAFIVATAGEHELSFEPFQEMNAPWLSCIIEPDPDDRLEPVPTLRPAAGNVLVSRWGEDEFWREQRSKLETSHAVYRDILTKAFAWSMQHQDGPDHRSKPVLDLPLLVAAHRLGMAEGALDRALNLLDEAISREYWGKAAPGAYGHNGDMGAALLLRVAAWAVHMIRPDELGPERRRKLLEKLAHQGDRFIEQMLLNRDYWGGSLRQDHGWRSCWLVGTAALLLLGILPQAETWLQYMLPRMRRSLDVMSRNGMIPPSSHGSLFLYVDEASEFRRTLLAMGGEDIYERGQFRPIVDFVTRVLKPDTSFMLLENATRLTGGSPFFADLARTYRDTTASWLLQRQLQQAQSSLNGFSECHSLFWSFFVYDPTVAPQAPAQPQRRLSFFRDDARVQFQDNDQDVTLFVRCGPENGYHAYFNATGPCDRTEAQPHAGHFVVYLGQTPMLTTPISGYRLRTAVGSALLIDDQGQIGDSEYPMGHSHWRDPGHHIAFARTDEQTGEVHIRMDLKLAYPEHLGLAHYTRDLIVKRDRCIICRDYVVLDRPRKLSWLFQVDRAVGVQMTDQLRAVVGQKPRLTIEAVPAGVPLRGSVHETEVVHSYSSSFRTFDHVRYDTGSPILGACVDFILQW